MIHRDVFARTLGNSRLITDSRIPATPMTTTAPEQTAQSLIPSFARNVEQGLDSSERGPGLDLGTEWVLTDGQGGFSMGTALGVPTRRYHAWLVAATAPPVGRVAMLNACVEHLIVDAGTSDEQRFDLSSFLFPNDKMHPTGAVNLESFKVGTTCRWRYALGDPSNPIRVERELCLLRPDRVVPGRAEPGTTAGGAVIVRYRVEPAGRRVTLQTRPLISIRDFHNLLEGRSCPDRFNVLNMNNVVSVEVAAKYGRWLPRLNLSCGNALFVGSAQWWFDFEYPRDAERGQPCREDLFSPGMFLIECTGGERASTAEFAAWTGTIAGRPTVEIDAAAASQAARLTSIIERAEQLSSIPARGLAQRVGVAPMAPITPIKLQSPFELDAAIAALTSAADKFIVRRAMPGGGTSATVIAGYPWFSDWGRDTMICLPGLLLATGRFEEARQTLETFATMCRDGLLPNCFDDATGAADYNTVDAPLWFIHAACRYAEETGDSTVYRGVIGRACLEIINAYKRGTLHGIKMDPADGLIMAGDPTTQLTWMDAKRDGVVFTPRFGKCVEINALWYHALRSFAKGIESDQPALWYQLDELAGKAAASFRAKFWNARASSCYDVLNLDAGAWKPLAAGQQTRPNQIFAASLGHSPLTETERAGVVQTVWDRLATPMGLRSLSASDPGYIGRFKGTLFERDRAYHNGTVWPWLVGPFVESVMRKSAFSHSACEEGLRLLAPLVAELDSARPGRMLGQLAEVYDGDDQPDAPRAASGCLAQAWSVSEVLRVLVMIRRASGG